MAADHSQSRKALWQGANSDIYGAICDGAPYGERRGMQVWLQFWMHGFRQEETCVPRVVAQANLEPNINCHKPAPKQWQLLGPISITSRSCCYFLPLVFPGRHKPGVPFKCSRLWGCSKQARCMALAIQQHAIDCIQGPHTEFSQRPQRGHSCYLWCWRGSSFTKLIPCQKCYTKHAPSVCFPSMI